MYLETIAHAFAHEEFEYRQNQNEKGWRMAKVDPRQSKWKAALDTVDMHPDKCAIHLRDFCSMRVHQNDNSTPGHFILQGSMSNVPENTAHALSRVFALVLLRRFQKDNGPTARILGTRQ
jgi:hypothetical protein